MSAAEFISQMMHNPMLMVSVVLTLGVILVNGWTDAPNAIATCVSTRAIGVRKAIIMAAIFNFLGVLVMTALNASVAMTIYNMVDFGGDARISLIALCAAMAAIVIWATVAWYFGIPTSESHALIAGISGAAVAINNSFDGINGAEWIKVIYGIVFSTVLGFIMGFITSKITVFIFRNQKRIYQLCISRIRFALNCINVNKQRAQYFGFFKVFKLFNCFMQSLNTTAYDIRKFGNP